MEQVASSSRRGGLFLFCVLAAITDAWTLSSLQNTRSHRPPRLFGQSFSDPLLAVEEKESTLSRRSLFKSWLVAPVMYGISSATLLSPVQAMDTSLAEITDRVYITIKGLPSSSTATATEKEPNIGKNKRIVIGLFGKDAPNSVAQFKLLMSRQGLPAPCRPKAERALQKEQLEANKVYNSCKEFEDTGVSLDYSTIWRIIKNERIDVGAVTGRFVAREYPEWKEETSAASQLLEHDAPGVVSVRRGNDGGFGFTIFPGGGKNVARLDEDHIVVGRVLEGMDVVNELNEIPVVASAKVNYMALTGGARATTAPDRSCRYGGPMYCNENKPLVKLTIPETGGL